MVAPLQDPFPMVELASPPRAHPLVEPRLVTPTPFVDDEDEIRPHPVPSFLPNPGHRTSERIQEDINRLKRESFNLSGSTYLITNTGKTIKLPVPSNSPADPLNWSQCKSVGAVFAIVLFSIVCLTAAQGAAVMLQGIQQDFQHEVSVALRCSRPN